ncbi:hypothetical protein E3Q23_01652 [Wallemia mellicola]|uniref:Fes1-domain-containing protein n=1 Tax=Wallemia mellicola TaxID=1708541 RepID=A0A4T0TQA5_9BASI|nr:hypothetical protein E3Q23_01652 [Wallemia mellicola]TIC05560.1 Fes1-domain-containing protein [Wallemia mellicola]TIC20440.1 Fes1-domain-containing protein [Wallemia mellicola]TIC67297.1 Fes1-domain-containing protein [Wallemia mellicola]TIC69162.1 Fes1-domain-containing protein [Wallemia mellicola]
MEQLLQWGLTNSVKEDGDADELKRMTEEAKAQSGPGQKYDPAVLDKILGKSDAEMMKEAMYVAVNDEATLDNRLIALDNFEMLVEQVDNAKNMKKIGLWDPIYTLLKHNEDDIKIAAAACTGSAINNDYDTQDTFMELDPLPLFISYLNSSNKSLQNKAVLNISGLLKHNPVAIHRFGVVDGWSALRRALEDTNNINLQRKVTFLLNSLLLSDDITMRPVDGPTSTATGVAIRQETQFPGDREPRTASTEGTVSQALYDHGILDYLLNTLPPNESDLDLQEKALRVVITLTQQTSKRKSNEKGYMTQNVKSKLRECFAEIDKTEQASQGSLENLGITSSEIEQMQDLLG